MKLSIKLGLIAGALSGSALILEYLYFPSEDQSTGVYALLFSMFNLIAFIYAAVFLESKNEYETQIPFNLGVIEGLKVAAMVGLCMGAASIIYFNVIDPTYLDTFANQAQIDMAANGFEQDKIDSAIDNYYTFNSWWMKLISQVVLYLVAGVAYSLLISFMVRRMPIQD